jgi:tyrosine-protein kinase Etk/Wzc
MANEIEHSDDGDEITLLDLGVVVAENLRLLVLGPLVAAVAAFGVCFLVSPIYTARTAFIPPQQQQSTAMAALSQLGALSGFAASATSLKNPSDQYVALLKSTTVADRLIDRFKLMEVYGEDFRHDTRAALNKKVSIAAGKEGLISVEVDDKSSQRAADIANAYVVELRTMMSTLALTEAQNRRVFFEKQLEQTKTRLTAAEMALGAIGVSASAVRADPKASVEAVARLQAQATLQEVKLASMRGYLVESAPEFRQAQAELAALRAQLRKSSAGDPAAVSAGGYIEKYRDYKYQETLFELFARQFELAKVDEAREGAIIQVVDAALPPERKSKPKKALIAILTAFVSGVLLLLWVFVRKALDISESRPQDAGKLAAIRSGIRRLFLLRR